jgi:hypothetical protein
MEILNRTLEKMPFEFNSNQFCNEAKKNGYDQYKINQGLIAEFLHKNCKQVFTKRRWQKKIKNNLNIEKTMITPKHYNNRKGSLYKFAEENELNAWEFDIIKRIVRCRKKGAFKEDLIKTKFVIELYLNEYQEIKTRVENSEEGC